MQGSMAAQFYEARQAEAFGLISAYQELLQHIDGALSTLSGQIGKARLELAQAYLPELTPAALERVKVLSGFLGFERRDPLKAMAHEKMVLEHTIARIEKDERYVKREELASPHGTLQTELIEVREHLAPFVAECQVYESKEDFLELVRVGYDTPRFEVSWWQPSYWKYWAAGDRICKELDEEDFGDDILPKYVRAAEQRGFWQGEEAKLSRQLEAIHALVQEHDQAQARIPSLPALYLLQCQNYLGEYLEQADGGLLEGWLEEQGGDRSVLISLRTLAGLKAKQEFLQELKQQGVMRFVEDLRGRTAKFARKTQKYLRSKHYWREIPDRELDHKFASKVSKYHEQRNKLTRTVDKVLAYDAYGRFSLDNDPALWWVEFTGKTPPRQLASTRRWYERNKHWRVQHDEDDTGGRSTVTDDAVANAVAAAAVHRELDEVGYLS